MERNFGNSGGTAGYNSVLLLLLSLRERMSSTPDRRGRYVSN
jgi:hypothetical protein